MPRSANGGEFLEAVLARGGEGIVRKPLNSTWTHGWQKCKRCETFDVIVSEIHGATGTVSVFQFAPDGSRVDCGRVSVMRVFDSVRVGTVLELRAFGRNASGKLREARLVKIRADKLPADCLASL